MFEMLDFVLIARMCFIFDRHYLDRSLLCCVSAVIFSAAEGTSFLLEIMQLLP
jgi:hypothetical protein